MTCDTYIYVLVLCCADAEKLARTMQRTLPTSRTVEFNLGIAGSETHECVWVCVGMCKVRSGILRIR